MGHGLDKVFGLKTLVIQLKRVHMIQNNQSGFGSLLITDVLCNLLLFFPCSLVSTSKFDALAL